MKIEIRWWQVRKFLFRGVITAATVFFLLQLWQLVEWVALGVKTLNNGLTMIIHILQGVNFS